jgi:predicted peptidase
MNTAIKLFCIFAAAVLLAVPACAVYAIDVMEPQTFTDSAGTVLPYRIYIPPAAANGETDKLPLLLYLHGSGHRGTDNTVQVYFEPGIFFRVLGSEYKNCILVAPQCPDGMQWVDTPWEDGSYNTDKVPESKYLHAVYELVLSLLENAPTDPDRVYVTGLSMGGYGTWDLILRHPELFAAAVPICGAGDPSKADAIMTLPVWIFHGAADEVVPLAGSRDMAAALTEAGSSVFTYTEYPGVGHNCWTDAYFEENLLDWLFAQSKSQPAASPADSGASGRAVGQILAVTLIALAGLGVWKAVSTLRRGVK